MYLVEGRMDQLDPILNAIATLMTIEHGEKASMMERLAVLMLTMDRFQLNVERLLNKKVDLDGGVLQGQRRLYVEWLLESQIQIQQWALYCFADRAIECLTEYSNKMTDKLRLSGKLLSPFEATHASPSDASMHVTFKQTSSGQLVLDEDVERDQILVSVPLGSRYNRIMSEDFKVPSFLRQSYPQEEDAFGNVYWLGEDEGTVNLCAGHAMSKGTPILLMELDDVPTHRTWSMWQVQVIRDMIYNVSRWLDEPRQ
jgi:hypothetical protein